MVCQGVLLHRDCADTYDVCFITVHIYGIYYIAITFFHKTLILYYEIFNIFLRFIQESLVQASFWHDPLNIDEYKEKSIFLSDINNENSINVVCINECNELKF